ncbi:hypothetical protein AB1P01_04635 (plasmid) [Borreliella burgdorferi]
MNNQKFQKPPIVNNIKNLASLFANKTRVFFFLMTNRTNTNFRRAQTIIYTIFLMHLNSESKIKI